MPTKYIVTQLAIKAGPKDLTPDEDGFVRTPVAAALTEESEHDIVMANPPFTGSIDKGDINENLQLATTKTKLLFVENIFRLRDRPTGCAVRLRRHIEGFYRLHTACCI
ncbi:hypothetical protein [Acidithiobacillus concretivorus]|uniref:hypothetical protein n=1 Tax=Acidithiobacillus concretivorus TaxID=3063952 RepID=UPI001C077AEB|nr:hypothetical protein [Acidithiobacillus concretivorus]